MVEDRLKHARDVCGRELLKAQSQAAQHISTCPRCEKIFLIAHGSHIEQLDRVNPVSRAFPAIGLHPAEVWLITKELLCEFRQCTDWPNGAF